MKAFSHLAATLLLALLLPTPLAATSPWYIGTILDAEPGEDGALVVTVLVHMDNYKKFKEERPQQFVFAPELKVYLDGAPADAAEACQPGRMLTYFTNHSHLTDADGTALSAPLTNSRRKHAAFVSTAPGPAITATPGSGRCTVLLAHCDATEAFATLVGEKQQKEPKSPLTLVLPLHDGAITGGVALTPDLLGATWHEIDTQALQYTDGRLTGSASIRFRGIDGQEHPGTLALTDDGRPSYRLTFDGHDSEGRWQLVGQASQPPGPAPRLLLWIMDDRYGGRRYSYLTCRFQDGKADNGGLFFRKGEETGALSATSLQLQDGALTGSFTASGKHGEFPTTITGRILDQRFVVADLRFGDQTLHATGFLSATEGTPLSASLER